jgi:hypothetical protein
MGLLDSVIGGLMSSGGGGASPIQGVLMNMLGNQEAWASKMPAWPAGFAAWYPPSSRRDSAIWHSRGLAMDRISRSRRTNYRAYLENSRFRDGEPGRHGPTSCLNSASISRTR